MYSLMSNIKFRKKFHWEGHRFWDIVYYHIVSLVSGLVTGVKQKVSDVMIDFCRCHPSHNNILCEYILSSLFLSCFALFHGRFGVGIFAFIGIHTIDGNILMPLVVGSKVKINALFAFIGIIIGEMIWGISGMFLVIPYLAMLKIIFERVEGLQPWGALLGVGHIAPRKRKTYRITKKNKNFSIVNLIMYQV